MRAFALPSADAEPAVVELPDPVPGPGEVLVRVVGSSLNGFDRAVRVLYGGTSTAALELADHA